MRKHILLTALLLAGCNQTTLQSPLSLQDALTNTQQALVAVRAQSQANGQSVGFVPCKLTAEFSLGVNGGVDLSGGPPIPIAKLGLTTAANRSATVTVDFVTPECANAKETATGGMKGTPPVLLVAPR